MPIIEGGLVGTTWGTYRRKVITICGLIAAVTGAIVGIAKAAPIIEPYWYASHGYVRDEFHHPLLARVIEIQIKQADAERKRLLRDVQRYELELQSDQAKATPQYHALIQKEVERTKNEINDNDAKQKSLFDEQKASGK
jgi:hypothetical protein